MASVKFCIPHSASLQSTGYLSEGAPIFVAATHERPLDHLALAEGFSLRDPTSLHRTDKAFLTRYHPQGKAQRQKTEVASLSLCKRGLSAYLHSCSLRGRFLIKYHLRASYAPLQRPQMVGTIFAPSLAVLRGQHLQREAVHTSRTPVFNLVICFYGYYVGDAL